MKNGLWTVKEVKQITGLNGKHLHHFHKTNVVLPAGFSNHSVNGKTRYKLYNDAGLAKLQQIAMYYELGLRQDQICDLMTAPGYDLHRALDQLKIDLEEKRNRIDRHIAAIDQIRYVGTRNGLLDMFTKITLEDRGKTQLALNQSELSEHILSMLDDQDLAMFESSLNNQLIELSKLNSIDLPGDAGEKVLEKLFRAASLHLGFAGFMFVMGLFMSAVGEGSMTEEVAEDLPVSITAEMGNAALSYLKKDGDSLLDEMASVIATHHEVIGGPFDAAEVLEVVDSIKPLLEKHYGIRTDKEYSIILDIMDIKPYAPGDTYLSYIANAIKYHCNNT